MDVMSEMDDTSVAAYLGLTAEQVRIIRQKPSHLKSCKSCEAVHPTFPSISVHHSPCCDAQQKCSMCGEPLPVTLGHGLGIICIRCYGDDGADD